MKQLHLASPVRVEPFTGLIIDVDTWSTAHDYHRRHHQLHLLTLHGCGIACGLEVVPTEPASDTIIVERGVAVDALGNAVVVPESQRIAVEPGKGIVFVVLDYVESLPPAVDSQDPRGRLVEDFRLRTVSELPDPPALELARVQLSGSPTLVITAPVNPWAPAPGELDSRFRLNVFPCAPKEVRLALIVCGPQEELAAEHLAGFHHLLRELAMSGLRCVLVPSNGDKVPEADLVYVTGSGAASPSDKLVSALTEHVKKGGWLFADACGPGVDFVQAFRGIGKKGQKAGSNIEAMVLNARHVFRDAPPGAVSTAEIHWGENSIISPRDFGCAWAGGRGQNGLPREGIRSALEFGVNVATCASNRVPRAITHTQRTATPAPAPVPAS